MSLPPSLGAKVDRAEGRRDHPPSHQPTEGRQDHRGCMVLIRPIRPKRRKVQELKCLGGFESVPRAVPGRIEVVPFKKREMEDWIRRKAMRAAIGKRVHGRVDTLGNAETLER